MTQDKIIKELEKALKPFARIAEVLGDTPPAGVDDVLHMWQRTSGDAELRLSDCVKAKKLLKKLDALG